MIGIQLIFEGGIDSPIFNAKQGNADPFETFDMKDHKMTSIEVKVNGNCLNQICMNNQAGNRVEITKSYYANGNFEARPIPENHTIVGVYGQIN